MVPHLTPSCGGGTSSYLYKVGGKDRLGVLSPQYYVPCGAVKALSKEQISWSPDEGQILFFLQQGRYENNEGSCQQWQQEAGRGKEK